MNSTPFMSLYVCDGALALTTAAPRFRVIEGGRSARRSQQQHERRLLDGLVLATMLALAVAGSWLASDLHHRSQVNEALAEVSYQTVTVMPGTTLWDLAEAHPVEGCSTHELIDHLRERNGLDTAALTPGMQLSIPATSLS